MQCSRLAASRRLSTMTNEHGDTRHGGQALPWLQEERMGVLSSRLVAGHLRDAHRIHRHRRRRHSRVRHRQVAVVRAGELH